jgi:tetratricopeptide (TPR) repeat protein
MESPLFVTRDEWKTHLRLDHRSSHYWECSACTDADNAIVFSTPDDFMGHMQELHRNVSDVDASRLLDICVRSDPISVKICPLCVLESQSNDMDPETLLDHIGDHMHDFALQSLPWMDTPENISLKYLADETVSKITKWFNEVVPSVDSAEEHHPAYPSDETVVRAITFSVGLPELMPRGFAVSGELGSNINPNPGDYFAESRGATSQAQPDSEITLSDYQAMTGFGSGSGTPDWEVGQHGQPGINVQKSRVVEGDRIARDADDGGEKGVLGPEHPDTLSHLGSVLERQRGYEEAEAMHRRDLEGSEKVLGPEHQDTLTSVSSLGSVLSRQGKYEEAELMHRRALQGYEKTLGAEHISTLHTVNNLGYLYSSQGKLGKAEKMYERALQGYERKLGAEHISTLDTVNNLGSLYSGLGKLGEAEKMYERALQGYEKAVGPEHTSTIDTVNNLGSIYSSRGKLGDAGKMYERALQGREKVFGAEHPSTLAIVNNLAILYQKQGKMAEAEKVYERALQGREEVLGAKHPSGNEAVQATPFDHPNRATFLSDLEKRLDTRDERTGAIEDLNTAAISSVAIQFRKNI